MRCWGVFGAAIAALLLWGSLPASAQPTVRPCVTTGTNTCPPVSASNPLPVTASVSISGFAPATTGTPISVTTGGVTGTLPAGAVVVASNVGATNGAYCKLGASATTSDQLIPPNSWFAFTVGASTQLTCITGTSTTTVNMVGGAGIPTGAGGGGGGSGGGAVTVADGADVTQGAKADAAWSSGDGTVVALLKNLAGGVASPVPTTAPSDCSGTVTSGGTAQSIIGAGTAPHGFQIQNLSTDALGFSWTTVTPAVGTNGTYTLNAGSSSTSAGGSYNSPLGIGISAAVFLIGATTGDKFTCSKW